MRGDKFFYLAVILIISFTIVCFLGNTSVAQDFQLPYLGSNYIDNMGGISNMGYSWASGYRGNTLSMMTNMDAYSGYMSPVVWVPPYPKEDDFPIYRPVQIYEPPTYDPWEPIFLNPMDLMKMFMNQSMNQLYDGMIIPPFGQEQIYVGQNKPIRPIISGSKLPLPIIMPSGNWPGTYGFAAPTGVLGYIGLSETSY